MEPRTKKLVTLLVILVIAAAGFYGFMLYKKSQLPPPKLNVKVGTPIARPQAAVSPAPPAGQPAAAAAVAKAPAAPPAKPAPAAVAAEAKVAEQAAPERTNPVLLFGIIVIPVLLIAFFAYFKFRDTLFGKKQQIIGLDIGSHSIKMAQIVEKGKDLVIVKFGMKELSPESIVDGTIMDRSQVAGVIGDLIAELQLKQKEVAIGVSGNSVIVKRISLPEMGEEELAESINWEAEQYIPFAIDDVNLDFQILGPTQREGANTMDVVLVAAKKDKINDYISLVTEAGLTPVIMDVDAFALENMFEVNYELESGRVDALVNIGSTVMNINILKDGLSVFTRDSSVGGNNYTETLQKQLSISYEAAEGFKRGEDNGMIDMRRGQDILDTVSEDIASEASRSIDFFRATTGIENVDRVVISGGSAMVNGFLDIFAEKVGVAVELANPFRNISVDQMVDADLLQRVAPSAAVVVGLALRRVGD